jgi:hypothetical protein
MSYVPNVSRFCRVAGPENLIPEIAKRRRLHMTQDLKLAQDLKSPKDHNLLLKTGDQSRLLRYLDREGAFAMINPQDALTLDLFRSVAGVTMGGGTVALMVSQVLCAQGQLTWIMDGARRKLIRADDHLVEAAHDTPVARQAALSVEQRTDARGQAQIALVNRAESPLAWLRSRKDSQGRPMLSSAGFAAGERMRHDMEAAHMLPRLSASWSDSPSAKTPSVGILHESERAMAARQRVDRALTAVGPEFSGLLTDVCGFLKGLPQIEMERGWPPRSARIVLGLALDRLLAHYGAVSPPSQSRHVAMPVNDGRAKGNSPDLPH